MMQKLPPQKVMLPGLLREVTAKTVDFRALEQALAIDESSGERIVAVGHTEPQRWYLVAGVLILFLPFSIFGFVEFTQERFCQILVALVPLVSLLIGNYLANIRSIVVFTNQRLLVIFQGGRVKQLGALSDCIVTSHNGKVSVRVAEREYLVNIPAQDLQQIEELRQISRQS
ncbi:MAG TPA: hypothetical protein V6C89_18260 [Drouetiella sp.]